MADKSQPSVRDLFSKVNHDEFCSRVCFSSSIPAIPLITKEEQKEYQIGRKRRNMRDSRNRRKVKDIAELLITEEIKESEVEMSGTAGGKIESSEIGEGQVQGSEIGESEIEESESEVEGIEVENWGMENSSFGRE